MEGLEKGRKKKPQPMRLEDLKNFKPTPRESEPKAHSLSSAASDEGSLVPASSESAEASNKTNVDHAVEQVLLAHKDGRDVQAVYEHQDQALTSEEAKEFNNRLAEELTGSGIDVIVHTAPEAVQADKEQMEKPEWSDLLKRNRKGDGEVAGRKFWKTEDGGVYVDSRDTLVRNKIYGGSVPLRIAHGGKYVTTRDGKSVTMYWDKNANAFTDADPAPEVRERQRALQQEAKTKEPSSAEKENVIERIEKKVAKGRVETRHLENNSEYSEEELAAARSHLERRLKALPIKADKFMKLGERLVTATTPADVRALSAAIGQLEPKLERSRKKRERPADAQTPEVERAAQQDQLQTLNGTVDLNRLEARAQERASHPTGPRITRSPRPDLRGDMEKARDDFAQDHRPSRQAERRQRAHAGIAPQQRSGARQEPSLVASRTSVPQQMLVGVVPTFIKRRSSREAIGVRARNLRQGPTMDAILSDPKQQELFGEMVKARGTPGLFVRYTESSTTPDSMQEKDYTELTGHLQEFEHRMQLLEEVQENLTTEDVAFMLAHNPAFAVLRVNLKPERAAAVMKQALTYTFMRGSNADINAIVISQRSNKDIRLSKHYAGLNERTDKRIGQLGIKADDINWSNIDRKLARKILRPGLLKKVLSRQTTKRAHQTLSAIALNRMAIGNLLAGTLSQDRTLVARIAQEAQHGIAVPEVGARGIPTMKDTVVEERRISENLDQNTLLARVRAPQFRADFRDLQGRTWESSTPEAREEAIFDFYEREATARRGLLGWFSGVLSALFGARVEQARRHLRTNNAFT